MRPFFLIPCFSLLAAGAVLADDILAPGPPALTRSELTQIVTLVEWTLDARLSPQEHDLFERTQIAAWSNFDQTQRQNMLALARMPDTVATLSPADKAKFHDQLQQGFLEMIRKTPDSPGSKLLLAVYDRAHGGNARSPQSGPVAGGAIPSELIGEWGGVHTSSVGYVDRSTGSMAAPSGTGMNYHFYPDGRFESAALIQSSMYSCTMTVNAFERGTLRVNGNVIVFDSAGGTLDSKDNCNARFNYRKVLPARQTTYNWRLERDSYGVKFCIVKPGVKEDCMYRKN